MVIPVFGTENRRNAHADDRSGHSHGGRIAAGQSGEKFADGQYAQTDPNRKGVERTGINVVAFARLAGRSVEVKHQRDTRHNEENHHDGEVALVAVQLVKQTDQSQEKRQKIIGITALVFGDFVRKVVLRASEMAVDPFDTREPVAVRNSRPHRLDVALSADEIPKEITPVHVTQLVVEEIVEIFQKRGFDDGLRLAVFVAVDPFAAEIEHDATFGAALFVTEDFTVLIAQRFDFGAVGGPLFVTFALARIPHAREQVHELRIVLVSRQHPCGAVLAVLAQIEEIAVLVVVRSFRSGEIGPHNQRTIAILIAVEQRQQSLRIARVIGVHRRIGRSADRHRSVGRIADKNHRDTKQQRIPHDMALRVGPPCEISHATDKSQREDRHARIDRQPQDVDEEDVDHRTYPDRVGNNQVVDDDQHGASDQESHADAFERRALGTAEIVDECQRRNGQQIEDMHTDRQAHQIGNQHDPAEGSGFVGVLLPFEHQPHDQRREHRRQGVDLALDGRKPECIGERVGQCPDNTGTENGPRIDNGQFAAIAVDEPPRKMRNRPEKKEYAECTRNGVHCVDGNPHIIGVSESEQRGEAGQHHEERRPGRVTDLQFIRGGDKLRAVPKARHGFHRLQINERRNGEDRPSDEVVPTFEKIHIKVNG